MVLIVCSYKRLFCAQSAVCGHSPLAVYASRHDVCVCVCVCSPACLPAFHCHFKGNPVLLRHVLSAYNNYCFERTSEHVLLTYIASEHVLLMYIASEYVLRSYKSSHRQSISISKSIFNFLNAINLILFFLRDTHFLL